MNDKNRYKKYEIDKFMNDNLVCVEIVLVT